jgi:hypothetical protein
MWEFNSALAEAGWNIPPEDLSQGVIMPPVYGLHLTQEYGGEPVATMKALYAALKSIGLTDAVRDFLGKQSPVDVPAGGARLFIGAVQK